MNEQKKFGKSDIIAQSCALHEYVVRIINEKAESRDEAFDFLRTYFFSIINALAIQSETRTDGQPDIDKAMDKTGRILSILEE